MPCYSPLIAHYSKSVNDSGKRSLVFNSKDTIFSDNCISVPCGQCIGCRLERSRQWALRCEHEAMLHEQNSFITLTYNDENLPADGSLVKADFQKFMKRLRRRLDYDYNVKIRFYGCGEYGQDQDLLHQGIDALGRPHFHAIIFGYGFYHDRQPHKKNGDNMLYTSALLDSVWQKGFCSVGEMTFESAAYCARYCLKKVTGDEAVDHYQKIDRSTGEVVLVEPEFQLASRNPGIGKKWYDKFKDDLKKDFITSRGVKMRPAKYYDYLTEKYDPFFFESIKKARKDASQNVETDPERLLVSEQVKLAQISNLSRKL
ncbi:replication initiator protein [Microviridae sp.]|nr:replication initiator protein [Microviridae sp.]